MLKYFLENIFETKLIISDFHNNMKLRINNKNFRKFIIAIEILVVSIAILIIINNNIKNNKATTYYEYNFKKDVKIVIPELDPNDILDFEGFNNEKGSDVQIVPNIVHYLYLQETYVKFYAMINIFSLYLNSKPDLIYIHCDNCSLYGKYWNVIKSHESLFKIIRLHQIPYRETIFGIRYGWINHHRSDIWRLLVLMHYGGIYLDNDVFVIKSLKKYLNYEMTLSWDSDDRGIGSQVMIAHRNARFLRTFYDSFRYEINKKYYLIATVIMYYCMYRYNYTPTAWYWNGGYMPAKIMLKYNQKYLVHIVVKKLGTHDLIPELYKKYWPGWRKLETIHLLINWAKPHLKETFNIDDFNETNIVSFPNTYGFMARDIIQRGQLKF